MCCDDEDFRFHLVCLGIPFVVCGIIGMLCMTAGYYANTKANEQLREATCVTQSWFVLQTTCFRSCCSRDVDNNCVSCTRVCYDGIIYVDIANVAQNDPVTVVGGAQTVADVQGIFQINYPIGNPFSCYYQIGTTLNSSSVPIQLSLNNVTGSYIAGLFFLSLAGLILFFWLILEFISFGIPCLSFCCGNLAHLRQQRRERHNRQQQEHEQQRQEEEKQEEIEEQEIAVAATIPPAAQAAPQAPQAPTAPVLDGAPLKDSNDFSTTPSVSEENPNTNIFRWN